MRRSRTPRCFEPDASLEVFAPSALSGPRRVFLRAASPKMIPLRRFAVAARPARPRTFALQRRPCGFPLSWMRCGACSMADARSTAFRTALTPLGAAADGCTQLDHVFDRSRVPPLGESETGGLTKRSFPSSATASITSVAWLGHAPSRSLARCSATDTAGARGLAGRKSPSLFARQRSWGFKSALRRFAPAAG